MENALIKSTEFITNLIQRRWKSLAVLLKYLFESTPGFTNTIQKIKRGIKARIHNWYGSGRAREKMISFARGKCSPTAKLRRKSRMWCFRVRGMTRQRKWQRNERMRVPLQSRSHCSRIPTAYRINSRSSSRYYYVSRSFGLSTRRGRDYRQKSLGLTDIS